MTLTSDLLPTATPHQHSLTLLRAEAGTAVSCLLLQQSLEPATALSARLELTKLLRV